MNKAKWYFINLWHALNGSKYPSGLPADTWFRLSKGGESYGFILTDSTGNVCPFVKHDKTFTWAGTHTHDSEISLKAPKGSISVQGWVDDLETEKYNFTGENKEITNGINNRGKL